MTAPGAGAGHDPATGPTLPDHRRGGGAAWRWSPGPADPGPAGSATAPTVPREHAHAAEPDDGPVSLLDHSAPAANGDATAAPIPDARRGQPAPAATPAEPADQGGPPADRAHSGGDDLPVTSARRAFILVASVLAVLALLRAPALVHAGEGMPPGTTRDVVLSVARPLESVTTTIGLDRPGRELSALFGHEDDDAPSELEAAAGSADTPVATAPGAAPATPTPPPTVAPARVPTAAEPLRVLVTGDSLTESLGPTIANTAPPTVHAETDTRFGTGLVRPDFFDWAGYAREQIRTRDPEVVIVAMGGNDGQGITMPDGTVLPAGSPQWVDEYRRRVLVVLRIWTDNGTRRVYWLSLPPARSSTLDGYFRQMNAAAADAAPQVPGATFLDLAPVLSSDGRYSDYLPDSSGRTVLARTRDGVHLTLDGARIAAAPVLAALGKDFKLS